jgi:hypothetical protein
MGNLRQKHRLKNKFPIAPFRNKHFNSDLNISTDFDLKKKKILAGASALISRLKSLLKCLFLKGATQLLGGDVFEGSKILRGAQPPSSEGLG